MQEIFVMIVSWIFLLILFRNLYLDFFVDLISESVSGFFTKMLLAALTSTTESHKV